MLGIAISLLGVKLGIVVLCGIFVPIFAVHFGFTTAAALAAAVLSFELSTTGQAFVSLLVLLYGSFVVAFLLSLGFIFSSTDGLWEATPEDFGPNDRNLLMRNTLPLVPLLRQTIESNLERAPKTLNSSSCDNEYELNYRAAVAVYQRELGDVTKTVAYSAAEKSSDTLPRLRKLVWREGHFWE